MRKRILILNGNPKPQSLCGSLTLAYATSARIHHDVEEIELSSMRFDVGLNSGYDQEQPLEADLQTFQEKLRWADHLVIAAPVWWGTVPARLKGLIDRTFLPGFAFRYEKGQVWPQKLLKGKSATLLLTLDTPPWYYRWFQGAPAVKQLKITTLEFCGFQNVRSHLLGPVIKASETQRRDWVAKARTLGEQGG
ncbi:MAG: NAD(P)H-dependent oxidoreductase [Gammaproteobacteria bacterium]|nr:NAD(P)H-dependent oxidoreductase [Gammaproteobacteria bacterium]